MDPIGTIVTIAGSIITAAIVGQMAADRALRRTKVEKRWAARYEAYQKIFSAFYDITNWAMAEYTAALPISLPNVSKEKREELGKRVEDAKQELGRFAESAALVISEASRKELREILKALWNLAYGVMDTPYEDEDEDAIWADYCHGVKTMVAERIPKLAELARKDLE